MKYAVSKQHSYRRFDFIAIILLGFILGVMMGLWQMANVIGFFPKTQVEPSGIIQIAK